MEVRQSHDGLRELRVFEGIQERGDGMNRELKPCPFRIHGERRESLTVAGEFFYNETFMPCMGKECACFKEDSVDAYCDRNGAFMTMTKEVTE